MIELNNKHNITLPSVPPSHLQPPPTLPPSPPQLHPPYPAHLCCPPPTYLHSSSYPPQY